LQNCENRKSVGACDSCRQLVPAKLLSFQVHTRLGNAWKSLEYHQHCFQALKSLGILLLFKKISGILPYEEDIKANIISIFNASTSSLATWLTGFKLSPPCQLCG
jgi:hypothetical protein